MGSENSRASTAVTSSQTVDTHRAAPNTQSVKPALSGASEASSNDRGLLHLGELIPKLRAGLKIDQKTLSDHDILESLKAITARTDTRARWLGAFNSPLGRWLALRGSDLNTELNLVLSVLPPARS